VEIFNIRSSFKENINFAKIAGVPGRFGVEGIAFGIFLAVLLER
jgi:hypothetical protein